MLWDVFEWEKTGRLGFVSCVHLGVIREFQKKKERRRKTTENSRVFQKLVMLGIVEVPSL